MRKKTFLALVLAGVMTLGMNVNVSALNLPTGVQDGNSFVLKKTVTTDGNTVAPNETFKFTVELGAAATVMNENNTLPTKTGVDGAITAADIAFTPDDEVKASYTETGNITVDISKFSSAGIYEYTLTEQNTGYEGITYDQTDYRLLVYIENDAGALKVSYVELLRADGTKTDEITNDYGKNIDSTHDVTFKKTITGAQADMTKKFEFKYSVRGSNLDEKYKVVTTVDGVETITYLKGDETPVLVNLGKDDTVHIFGLSISDQVSFEETEANQNGYTTTDQADGVSADTTVTDGKIVGSVTKDSSTGIVENRIDAVTPTGIVMTYGPYVLMVLASAFLGLVFFRRRRA